MDTAQQAATSGLSRRVKDGRDRLETTAKRPEEEAGQVVVHATVFIS